VGGTSVSQQRIAADAAVEMATAEWAAAPGSEEDRPGRSQSVPEAVLATPRDGAAPSTWPTAGAGRRDRPGGGAPPADRDGWQSGGNLVAGAGDAALAGGSTGIMSLVQSKDITYERLPMLEVVFDRLERMLTTSVRNFTSENVDISLENISAQRFSDYMSSISIPAMIAIYKAMQWDNYGLIAIDGSMIYSIIDVLLGGRRGTVPMRIEGRPYTTIEASLVERLIRLILDDLGQAFAPITPITFRFERMETNPRFAAIARPSNACIVFKLRIDLEERGGTIDFLIPYATLEPARDLLLQMFMGEKFGRDSIWENHLAREICLTSVELEAVLEEQTVSLQDVLNLKVGSTIQLAARPDWPVSLRCGQTPMATGRIGRSGDRLVIRVEERVETGEEPRP
jgi:flagellar motor switch protein FliM